MLPSPKQIKKFQKKILKFYQQHKRDLPWRKTINPYHILVSEIMLQQTQVDRVIPYYLKFLALFPNLNALANASKTSLLQAWSGLGYNSRVLRLQQLAQILVEKNQDMPRDRGALLSLPGIGPYTASAILAFAFNQPSPVIDTNIRRVLIYELELKENVSLEEIQEIAQQLIPQGKSREWHNALMDYGALYATARKTGIESLSKQSQFQGSTRRVRGYIVRKLLKDKTLNIQKLKQELREDYSLQALNQIIKKMEKENIIERKNNVIVFAEQ